MNRTLEVTMDMLSSLSQAAQIKINRNPSDFVADIIAKAASRSSLLSMVEAFAEGMQADVEYVSSHLVSQFMQEINSSDAPGVIVWLRKNYLIASSLLTLKNRGKKDLSKETRDDMFRAALEEIEIESCLNMGIAMPGRPPQIPFTIQTLSPLSHGADRKAGNSTLFRRQEVRSDTGMTLTLPIFGANAIRGIMRRELMDDFTLRLGLSTSRSNSPYSNWFLGTFCGGSLSEGAVETKALSKEFGGAAMRIQGIHTFRDMVLPLSVMGVSLGNRTLCRHGFDNYPGEPICREWGTGEKPESDLFTWEYLTRKDDLEIRDIGSGEKSNQMIANTECLKRGIFMNSGIDLMPMAQPLELSCVGHALELLFERGKIGANNRYSQGFVRFEAQEEIPDSQPYKYFIETHKAEIIDYLKNVGALNDDCLQLNLTSTAA